MTSVAEAAQTWDFHDESFSSHITTLHPYPARFPPAIPREAIKSLLQRPGVVLDPFAGCGTTLVEAQMQGHRAVGIDVNHLANLLQTCYTTPFAKRDQTSLKTLIDECNSVTSLDDADVVRDSFSHIPRLDHWFSPGAMSAIGTFARIIKEHDLTEPSLVAAKVALSRVLVRISRQESDTQYRAVKPDVKERPAWKTIVMSMEETGQRLVAGAPHLAGPQLPATCHLADSREQESYEGLPEFDLVVTSPPYPNAYEYWLYHKYRMFWLDMDPIWSRSREIGARPFYSGSGKKGADDFLADIRQVLANLHKCAAAGARQVWVVGDCIIKGEAIHTANLVQDAAEQEGWRVSDRASRQVLRSRSSFQGIGRLKREELLFLEVDE